MTQRSLTPVPPSEDYRQVGWHCVYHEQAERTCHNPLDCDMVPIWAITVTKARELMGKGEFKVNIEALLARLETLSLEQEAIEEQISQRAGKWYAKASGRTHFHPLEYGYRDADGLHFSTPIRGGDIPVVVPLEWFE